MKDVILGAVLLMIFLLSCNKEEDAFNEFDNGQTVIPKTTKVISSTDIDDYLSNIDSSNYTFTFSSFEVIESLKEGDIIVSSKGEGFLRKVTSVASENGETKLKTTQASITEAIQKASITFNSSLTTKSLSTEYPIVLYKDEGVKLNDQYLKSTVTENEILKDINFRVKIDEDNDTLTIQDQVILSGSLSLEPNLSGNWEIDNFNLESLNFEFNFHEELILQASYVASFLSLKKEKEILKLKYSPILVQAGPVPVVIQPELILFAGVNLSVNSAVETGIEQDFNFKAGVQYEQDVWDTYYEINKSFQFSPPDLSAGGSLVAYIKPQVNFKFYGTISPYISTQLYKKLSADITATPWWQLNAGIKSNAGVSMKIFKHTLADFNTNLFEKDFPIAEATEVYKTLPTVVTSVPSEINETSVDCGGEVTSDGGDNITERGLCWSTNDSPSTSDNKLSLGSGTGSFNGTISGLEPDTDYYINSYAINSMGIAYGQIKHVKTKAKTFLIETGEFTDERDNKTYKWVKIGTQTWMAENLAYKTNSGSWAYNNDENNVAVYGRLYDWKTALSACPNGWHLSSQSEWTELSDYLGGEYVAGGLIKESGTEHWKGTDHHVTNESGFTALPGGGKGITNWPYSGLGELSRFWTSSQIRAGNTNAKTIGLHYSTSRISGVGNVVSNSQKSSGLSVRCVKSN